MDLGRSKVAIIGGALGAILALASAASAQPFGNKVSFDARNYESIQDVMNGRAYLDVKVQAYLSLPTGASGGVPAVIIEHDTSGLTDDEFDYARALNEAGYATLVLDEYTDRRVRKTDDSLNPTRTADALHALRFLGANRAIDPARIAIVGFSRGGTAAYLTAIEPVRKGILGSSAQLRFAAHAAFYPTAQSFIVGEGTLSKVPIRFFFGRDDNVAPPTPWLDYFAFLKSVRVESGIEYELYDGGHGFERSYARRTDRAMPNFSRCLPVYYRVQGGHTEIFKLTAGRLVGMLRNELGTANCVVPGGNVGRTVEVARAKARQDLVSFLDKAMPAR